jgi:hypothetical protein
VVTPTRLLFVAPELLMGNRVLRLDAEKYPLERFLRVVFRDDDGQPVHATNIGGLLIDRFIGYKLRNGIPVAGSQFNSTFCLFHTLKVDSSITLAHPIHKCETMVAILSMPLTRK